jgi:hypothetical protein
MSLYYLNHFCAPRPCPNGFNAIATTRQILKPRSANPAIIAPVAGLTIIIWGRPILFEYLNIQVFEYSNICLREYYPPVHNPAEPLEVMELDHHPTPKRHSKPSIPAFLSPLAPRSRDKLFPMTKGRCFRTGLMPENQIAFESNSTI